MKPSKNQALFIPYLIKHRAALLQRDFLAEIFTHTERVIVETTEIKGESIRGFYSRSKPYIGKLVREAKDRRLLSLASFRHVPDNDRDGFEFYAITTEDTDFFDIEGETLTNVLIRFTVKAGDIENYPHGTPFESTVGRFIANYVLLASIYKDEIPYINGLFTPGKVLPKLPIEKTELYYRHVDHRQYITGCPEFYANNLTPKSLLTSPKIKAIKAKDIKDNWKAIVNGDASKCSAMEQGWQKLDNEYLKGDDSGVFLTGKLRNNSRKKMFVTNGLREKFGVPGQYDFTTNSLEEGWTAPDFPALVNESRMGSYNRSRETAKGGEESKFIIRVFQNTRVTEDDCGTKHYYKVKLERHNYKEYIGRNILAGNKLLTLDEKNVTPFIGSVVQMRSPLYCTAKQTGYCFTCIGESFAKTGQRTVAAVMTEIGSQMLNNSMKSMHNSTTKLNTLNNLNSYILKSPK